jgi:hypothetical protein
MRKISIVFILILTLLMSPWSVNTSTAGGGGGCSGEDEGQCLTVVWGTAAVIVIGVLLLAKYGKEEKPETPEKNSSAKEPLPTHYSLDHMEERQVTASSFPMEDLIIQNGDMVIWKW